MRKSLIILISCFFGGIAIVNGQQKQEPSVIQFAGLILGEDSTTVISGVHVYVPKKGRGTTTNAYGFFSLPVLEGDSIVFSVVGYKRAYFIVPEHDKESSLRVIVSLEEDIKFLEEVDIRPYPSEAIFKEALISMEVPYRKEYSNIYQWLNSDALEKGYAYLSASPGANHRYFTQLQQQAYTNKFSPRANPLLNPFAWYQFINSIIKK